MLFNMLYVEIEEFANADSLILTYYLLKCSGDKIKYIDEEKYSDRLMIDSYKSCCDIMSSIIEKIDVDYKDLYILTLSNVLTIRTLLEDSGIDYRDLSIFTLSEFLNVNEDCVFDIFNKFYPIDDSLSYLDMIETVITSNCIGVLSDKYSLSNIFLCLDLNNSVDDNNLVSWCLFSLKDNNIDIILYDEYKVNFDVNLGYTVLRLKQKELQYRLASNGVVLNRIISVYFSEYEMLKFDYFKCLISQKNIALTDRYAVLLNDMECLKYLNFGSYKEYNRLFSSSYKSNDKKCAFNIVSILSEMSKLLGLDYNNKFIVKNTGLRKDFSSDRLALNNRVNCSFGIILDCEGTVENGCTEVGGIIYCRKSSYLLKMETFSFTDLDINEGFETLLRSYENVIQRYIPNRGIDVLVFGSNDEKMVLKSFKGKQSKGIRKRIEKSFRFVDARNYIYDFLDSYNIDTDNRKLATVAECLGVKVIEPRHNALNDSKTLFNILAKILMKTDEFIF